MLNTQNFLKNSIEKEEKKEEVIRRHEDLEPNFGLAGGVRQMNRKSRGHGDNPIQVVSHHHLFHL